MRPVAGHARHRGREGEAWQRWPPTEPTGAGEWEGSDERRFPDGRRIVITGRSAAIDPLEQLMTKELRLELWDDAKLERTEDRTMRVRWYFPHELSFMLELAGFGLARVTGDYTDEPAAARHRFVVFHAVG